jgi:hypothetical protein
MSSNGNTATVGRFRENAKPTGAAAFGGITKQPV